MRVCIYYTHCESLGHTKRIIDIIDALKCECLVLQGGPHQPLLNKYVNVVDLPFPPYSKKNWHNLEDEHTTQKITERLRVCRKAIETFKPDVFVTEHFPFGRPRIIKEMIPLLKFIEGRVKIVGCTGYPLFSHHPDTFKRLSVFYDRLFVFSPSHELKYVTNYLKDPDLSNSFVKSYDSVREKIKFLGYMFDGTCSIKAPEVIISRGGGVVNPGFIAKSMIACSQLGLNCEAVIGPSSSESEKKYFQNLSEKLGIKVRVEADIASYLSGAKLSINMAGYNTSTELLYYGTPCLMFPSTKKDGSVSIEQGYRAKMCSELMPCRIMRYDVSIEQLKDAIVSQMKLNHMPLQKELFCAKKRLKDEIYALMHHKKMA